MIRAFRRQSEIRLCKDLYRATPTRWLPLLSNDRTARVRMIVAHNPGLETLVAQLAGRFADGDRYRGLP
jgi:phosphohistidine phosphatase SixA